MKTNIKEQLDNNDVLRQLMKEAAGPRKSSPGICPNYWRPFTRSKKGRTMISKKAAPNWTTVQTLQDIAEKVTTAHGWTCKPAGDEWLYIVIDMARAILDAGILDVITPADLEQLTA